MTIRHLLAHTSGLSYPFTSPTVLAIQTKTGTDPKELPLLFDPGTKWSYSPATAVLGDIVEKLSGQSIEEWDQAQNLSSAGDGRHDLHALLPETGRAARHHPPAGSDRAGRESEPAHDTRRA